MTAPDRAGTVFVVFVLAATDLSAGFGLPGSVAAASVVVAAGLAGARS